MGGGEKIKEIEAQTEIEISKSQSASAARQRVALELAQRLRYLRFINSKSNPQQGVILCHSFFECKFGVARSWGVVNSLVINLAMVICLLLFLVCFCFPLSFPSHLQHCCSTTRQVVESTNPQTKDKMSFVAE